MLLLLSAFVANKGIHSFIHYPPNTKISYENPSTTFHKQTKQYVHQTEVATA